MNEKSKTAGGRRLYISDLDGTLLRNNATLSAYSRTKLIELLAGGLNFTVASARSTYSLRHTLHGLALKLPVIEINGAYISELASGRHIVVNDMSGNVAGEVYRRAVEYKCSPFIITFTGTDDRLYYDNSINEGMDWYLDSRTKLTDPRLTQTDNLSEKFKEQVVAFTIINTYHVLKDLAEGIKADLDDFLETHFFENPYSPPWWWLTIHDKKACKSHAVKTLAEYAGFTPDELVVFGDSLNDIKLFRTAKKAVAVANASSEIRSLASEIIGANETDSVVKYIENDFAEKRAQDIRQGGAG